MWEDKDLFSSLQLSAGPIPIIQYSAQNPTTPNIVAAYNHALSQRFADFYLFCHQDVQGDIPAFLDNAIPACGKYDIVGAIGKHHSGATYWRDTTSPTPVITLDESCFGFFRQSDYTFDPLLAWTNYSQDLCCLARSNQHKALVVPNSIGHAHHKWGPWFVKSGIFAREHAYITKKWGPQLRS